ncbi:putative ABC transporter ATP-binding protein YxlF [Actinomadura sp. RB99]|uniref:ABC transporter ATP-binding protein n=1 Tax=Actinomadura sp. RB99 TaxID=2691577 RepID=UPI001686341D|nr:ABC transporter ATP-binding protein [Actinomadura sp. RB99]MBD2897208.1 putative ABC transporter ATP-binding protein YxlF [Actinomadura sp. RB99]
MPIIATQGLTMRFPRVTALDDLTVAVEPGVVGLVGANGAGKSTLIKILLGLQPPSAGTATVLGMDIAREGVRIRENVGFMPEYECLPPDVSATEFVVHMARMCGLPPTAARERAADTLRHVGLYEERYRPIGGYSTGMRQRVKLAQALVHDPKLVFLDEPTNGLDPAGRDEMLDLIRRIGAEFGISVLVTSHLLGELERVCDHVVIIDGGKLLRSQAVEAYTAESGVLTVEVDEGRDTLGQHLYDQGVSVHPEGRFLVIDIAGEATYDLVRDGVADLGLRLIRMEQRRHHIEEVFQTAPAETVPPGPPGPPGSFGPPGTPGVPPPAPPGAPPVPMPPGAPQGGPR